MEHCSLAVVSYSPSFWLVILDIATANEDTHYLCFIHRETRLTRLSAVFDALNN